MSGGSGGGRRLSIPLADREHALHDKDIDDTLHDTSLLRTQMKLVEKKDFTNEARTEIDAYSRQIMRHGRQ